MEFKTLIELARKSAGCKDNAPVHILAGKGELENLLYPEKARDLIMAYASVPMMVEIKRTKTPWTDNFGESSMIDLPLIMIEGTPSADTYWKRQAAIEYALERLNPTLDESKILEANLETIRAWRVLYRQKVGE
jgi:hypothetical protein